MRILLIEDEEEIAQVIQRGLESSRFSVDCVHDGEAGLDMALTGAHALIILDRMLPGMDGLTICQRLRSSASTVPILMLTALGSVTERVRGLEAGADDYLPKPFAFEELVARVDALVRRDKMHKARVVRVADLEIDSTLRRVTRAGRPITLTPREFTLLEALARWEGRILTREMILDQVWADGASYSNTVDVYIALLRKKIDTDDTAKLIHTVYGVGYTLKGPDGADPQ